MAKYFEMNSNCLIMTVGTDSMELYGSRLQELRMEYGDYTELQAAIDYEKCIVEQNIDWMKELSYWDKKRMHNLKYFTWIEQQGKTVEELDAQWYDDSYWTDKLHAYEKWDEMIREFNERTGLLKE